MSVYGELDPMIEHRTQFSFKGKREHIAKRLQKHIQRNLILIFENVLF